MRVKKVLKFSFDIRIVETATIEVDENVMDPAMSHAILSMVGKAFNGQPNVIPESIRFEIIQ